MKPIDGQDKWGKPRSNLEEIEDKYQRLVETTGTGYVILDDQGRVIDANQEYGRLTGRPDLQEVIGHSVLEWTAPYHFEKNAAEVRKCLEQGFVRNLEIDYLTPDGQVIPIEINATVLNTSGTLQILTLCRDISDRKLAEDALRENETRYRTFFEANPIPMWVFDIQTLAFLAVNNAAVAHYGYSREEFLSMTLADIRPPEDVPRLRESIQKSKEKIFQQPGIWRHCKKDGTIINVEITNHQLIYQGRQARLVLSHDVTERLKAEEEMRRSENLLQSILRVAPTGIGVVSNRVLLNVNDRICEMTGYSREELLNRNARILYPTDKDYEYVGTEKYRQIRERGTGTVETRWQCKDGRVIDVLMSSTPINPSDLSLGVTFTALDITERKKAEEELKKSHQTFLTVLDGIEASVYAADLDNYEILFMNKHMIDVFGADFTGRSCFQVFRGENRPCSHCTNNRLLDESGLSSGVFVWETKNPLNGKWYINHDRAIRWVDGRMVRLQISTDITTLKEMEEERKRITEQLIQAQKMESVGRLAGGVAHDFNNMLGVILGQAELGLLGLNPTEPIYTRLKEIQKAAQRSAELTRQLLAFARKQTVTPKILDLNETVAGMLKMLQRLIGEDIELIWKPGSGLWLVKVDPSQIDQILANLCVNARDAIEGIGQVIIETENGFLDEVYCAAHPEALYGEYVLLTVSDNGSGMSREVLDHLFEPFFTTKEAGKGTGLGMTTVYGIIKQNNGFINVSSHPGKGSIFKIHFPRFLGETIQPIPEITSDTIRGQGEIVLLVEDEIVFLNMGQSMLERLGYTVLAANTPSEALRQAKSHPRPIQLMITDVVMPEMNGRDLAKLLIDLKPGLKCLFTSGYPAEVIAHRGILEEGVHFLQKPFSLKELAKKVREAMENVLTNG